MRPKQLLAACLHRNIQNCCLLATSLTNSELTYEYANITVKLLLITTRHPVSFLDAESAQVRSAEYVAVIGKSAKSCI